MHRLRFASSRPVRIALCGRGTVVTPEERAPQTIRTKGIRARPWRGTSSAKSPERRGLIRALTKKEE
jgi:hypothetical protein